MSWSRKVNEKVKQTVPTFERAPPNSVSFSSPVEAIYSSPYCIVFRNCGGARNNRCCAVSVLSFHRSDLLGIVVLHSFVVLPLYCCHTSFSPEHEFSAFHLIISLENIWKPLPASSNRIHGIKTSFVQSFQELIWSEKIVERDKSMGVDVRVTQGQHHPVVHTLLSQVYCVWQVVKTPTIISNNPVESQRVHI